MASVKLNLDPMQKILLKRKLSNNGEAQKYFTHMVRTISDPYVPFDTGALKNTARESTNKIMYVTPYAPRQYYENAGGGVQGTQKGGLRGKQWVKRMWADRGPEIVKAVANYSGGRPG